MTADAETRRIYGESCLASHQGKPRSTARTRRAGLRLSSRLRRGAVREWLGVYPPSDGAQPNQLRGQLESLGL